MVSSTDQATPSTLELSMEKNNIMVDCSHHLVLDFCKSDSEELEHRFGLNRCGTFASAVEAVSAEDNNVKAEYFVKISWPEGRRVTVIATQDFTSTTAIPKRRLKLIAERDNTSDRVQRTIVFRKLFPITSLKGDHFWNAYWEIVRCHALVWKLGIHHGDINVSSLMYDSTRQKGVLNDYDLAVIAPQSGIPSSHGHKQTGTMAFMALQLLTSAGWHREIPRLYRHDLESFTWTLAWICYCYKDGRQKIQKAFKPWITNHYDTCGDAKGGFLKNFAKRSSTEPVPSRDYAKFAKAAFWLVHFWVQFDLDRVRQDVRKKDAAEEQKATKDNAVSDTGAGAPTEWANVKDHADVKYGTPPWKQKATKDADTERERLAEMGSDDSDDDDSDDELEWKELTDKKAIRKVILVVMKRVRLPEALSLSWVADM